MYPVWDKWIMPRCDVIPSAYHDDPETWSLPNFDDIKGPLSTPPIGAVRCEYILLDHLSHEKGKPLPTLVWGAQ